VIELSEGSPSFNIRYPMMHESCPDCERYFTKPYSQKQSCFSAAFAMSIVSSATAHARSEQLDNPE
jgi:hypothetical protein